VEVAVPVLQEPLREVSVGKAVCLSFINLQRGSKRRYAVRYAVPVSGGMVSPHFGHCEQFALIDVDDERKEIINKELVPSPGHQPGLLPEWLAEQGVAYVIASGMGSRAQMLFQQNRIGVILGALENDPEMTVLNYLQGRLATGDNICDH
jgi:ATP-binding protein involved in chromosome partitioning